MTTPQLAMLLFACSGALAVIILIFNFFRGLNSRIGGGFFITHAVCGLWAGGSWLGFIISTILVLIDYAKS